MWTLKLYKPDDTEEIPATLSYIENYLEVFHVGTVVLSDGKEYRQTKKPRVNLNQHIAEIWLEVVE